MDEADRQPADDSDIELIMLRFMEAATTGNLDQLQALMTDDIVAYSDGGDRVSAAIIPLTGKQRVSTVLLHLLGNMPSSFVVRWSNLNGKRAMIISDGEQIHSTHSIDILDGLIHRIYTMRNPQKLLYAANNP